MSENRFLQSFFAVAASSVLVGGSLILLTSTASWTPLQQAESEPSTPDSARLSPEAEAQIDVQYPPAPLASAQDQSGPEAEVEQADRTDTASAGEQPEPQEPEQAFTPEASSADDAVAALGTPQGAESDEGMDSDNSATEAMSANDPASESTAAPEASSAANDAVAELETPLDPVTDDAGSDDADPEEMTVGDNAPAPDTQVTDAAGSTEPDAATIEAAAASPEPEAPATGTANAPEPETPTARDKADAAADQIADLLTGLPPSTIASDQSEPTAPEVKVALVPPPPLPKRKPAEEPPASKEAALPAPKQQEPKSEVTRQVVVAPQDVPQTPRGFGPWQPMALAPADTPVVSQVPTARPSGAAYSKSVWSALARHKPRAGQSGSTTVVFAIGANGTLGALRVGRTSGNTRIDQLALATVRNAAPFPPPPAGSASYTIRIDFH